jgi:hypothetical protein
VDNEDIALLAVWTLITPVYWDRWTGRWCRYVKQSRVIGCYQAVQLADMCSGHLFDGIQNSRICQVAKKTATRHHFQRCNIFILIYYSHFCFVIPQRFQEYAVWTSSYPLMIKDLSSKINFIQAIDAHSVQQIQRGKTAVLNVPLFDPKDLLCGCI